ncbi:MAG: HDIG domain-containing protein [Candidatus Bathyarchaeota archaeon]|nr:HDIG domain-containing protein [Candidatus Bathyarchaeota archaeon]
MSERLPSREQAIALLKDNGCSDHVISHCLAVAELSLEIANKLQKKGLTVNLALVEAGALLHDIGRAKTHTVDHAVVGAQIAKSIGLPESIIKVIKRHVGAGITAEEAKWLGWPQDVYTPQSLEEKVVSYADKLIDKSERISIETEIKRLREENKSEAAQRVGLLHQEMTNLLGNEK